MDKVRVEVPFIVKVNLGPTPTIKLDSAFELSGTLKVNADLRLVVKPLHQPLPWAARVELSLCARTQCPSVIGRQTGSVMPSTTAVTIRSSASHGS